MIKDYSVESLVIKNGCVLNSDELKNFDRVKIVYIESDFKFDEGWRNKFGDIKSLERFVVIDEKSRLYTEDGVLFTDIREGEDEDFFWGESILQFFHHNFAGKVLVAFPANYAHKKYSIPEGTAAICKGAFAETNIEDLTIPDSVQFLDYYALNNTSHLAILRVPNKYIVRGRSYQVGAKNLKIVSNQDNCLLSQKIVNFWNSISGLLNKDELSDDVLGNKFEEILFSRYITWPDERIRIKMEAILSEKKSVFAFYSRNKHKINCRINNMLALLFYLVKPNILHPSTEAEAEILIDMMFDGKGVEKKWLLKYAGSIEDYEMLNRLYQTNLVLFFNYISNRVICKLFRERALEIMAKLSETNDTLAIPNLLFMLNDVNQNLRNNYREDEYYERKALRIDEPVSMWDKAIHKYKDGMRLLKESSEMFCKIAYGENTLPHPNIKQMKRLALNNYMWLKNHCEVESDDTYLIKKQSVSEQDPPF